MRKHKFLTLTSALIAPVTMITPLLVATSCKDKKQANPYAATAEMLKNDSIQIFKDVVCSKRHNSGDLEAILNVYKDWLFKLGIVLTIQEGSDYKQKTGYGTGKYGNAYFDIPPAEGCDDWNYVILQGHVDMIEDGFTTEEKIEIVETTVDGKKVIQSKDKKTSIGADNGAGIALMLAMAKNKDKFQHGKIRCLLSADEEPGMIGAAAVPNDWFDDYDYLINCDDENVGEIVISCAGGYSKAFEVSADNLSDLKTAKIVEKITPTSDKLYKITVSDLKASHSADVNDKMTNAIQMLTGLLDYLFYEPELSQVNDDDSMRLIQMETPKTTVTNAVAVEATAEFFGGPTLIRPATMKIFEVLAQDWIRINYPEETKAKVKIEQRSNKNDGELFCLSAKDSKKFVQLINKFLFGPISYLDKDKKLLESSSNIGPLQLYLNGETDTTNGDAKTPLSVKFYSRSCNNTIMSLIHSYNDALENEFKGIFTANTIKKLAEFPGWAPDDNNVMAQWLAEGYTLADVTPKKEIIHGGVEPAWWVNKKQGLQTAAVGPTITGCHTKLETLYIDTFFEEAEAILYALNKLKA